jgi:hypothetical protein
LIPHFVLRDRSRYADSIKNYPAVGLAGTFASRIQEIDSTASLEHASPADASARYFGELFESQTRSECCIADGH